MKWVKFLRVDNLVVVASTLYILRYTLLHNTLVENNIPFFLDRIEFALLVFSTVIVAAAGNIINDIHDMGIDAENKPESVIVGSDLSKEDSFVIYGLFVFIGGIPFFWLPVTWLLYYLAFTVLLWFYSYRGKRVLLLKNFIIAACCGAVPGMIWFTERESLRQLSLLDPEQWRLIVLALTFYIFFAFVVTLFRELIKDLEDERGDRMNDITTWVVIYGQASAKRLSLFFGILLIIGLGILFLLLIQISASVWVVLFGFCFLLIPSVWFLRKTKRAKTEDEFHQISNGLKWLIVTGLIYLPVMVLLN